jgi:Flp pilus assembly protein TadG
LRRRGQSVLYSVLLMPVLMLVLALAVDIGSLQMQKLRLRYAVDLATVTAATEVDAGAYTNTGRLQLDAARAAATTRDYLERNLRGLANIADPAAVASAAEVTVVNRLPALDPYTGMRLDRPAVCARIRVAHRFALLGWIGLRSVDLTVDANAEIRS